MMEDYGKPSLGFTPSPLMEKSLGTLQGSTSSILSEGHNFTRVKASARASDEIMRRGKALGDSGAGSLGAKLGRKLAKRALDLPTKGISKIAKKLDPRKVVDRLDPRNFPKDVKRVAKLGKKIGKKQLDVAKKVGKTAGKVAKKGFDVAKKVFDPFGVFGGGGYKKKPQGTRERVRQRSQSGPEGKGSHYQAASVRKAFRKGTYRVQESRRARAAAVQSAQARGESKSRVQDIRAAGTADVGAAKSARSARISAAREKRRSRKSTVSFAVPKKVY